MNFRQVIETGEDSFQIAPLIDIVFLLLTFFIVTGALAAQEKETAITLPRTTAAVTRPREKLDIVVNITREGRIWIYNKRYSIQELRTTLTQMQEAARAVPVSVIIRADSKALHEHVVQVLDACSAAGIGSVSFVSISAGRGSRD